MADFFDTTKEADLNLLHSSIREDNELSNVVDSVEYQIIDAFKQRDMERVSTYEAFFEYESGRDPSSEIEVRLVGYDKENPKESEDGLKESLRRTIAEVVSWVLRNYDNNAEVNSERQGQRSVTYSTHAPTWDKFPEGWDRLLSNYDARIKGYGI